MHAGLSCDNSNLTVVEVLGSASESASQEEVLQGDKSARTSPLYVYMVFSLRSRQIDSSLRISQLQDWLSGTIY